MLFLLRPTASAGHILPYIHGFKMDQHLEIVGIHETTLDFSGLVSFGFLVFVS